MYGVNILLILYYSFYRLCVNHKKLFVGWNSNEYPMTKFMYCETCPDDSYFIVGLVPEINFLSYHSLKT